MAKQRSKVRPLKDKWYLAKMIEWRTASGHKPEDVRKYQEDVALEQYVKWMTAFGKFREVWLTKVKPILERNEVPKLDYAKYRAFMNVLLSKVAYGDAKLERVREEFIDLKDCDPKILDQIVDALKPEISGESIGGVPKE